MRIASQLVVFLFLASVHAALSSSFFSKDLPSAGETASHKFPHLNTSEHGSIPRFPNRTTSSGSALSSGSTLVRTAQTGSLRLNDSATLTIGTLATGSFGASHTHSLNTATYTVTVAPGLKAQGNASLITIESSTLRPGEAPLVVDSHTLSLGTGGVLDIDSSTLLFPIPTPIGTTRLAESIDGGDTPVIRSTPTPALPSDTSSTNSDAWVQLITSTITSAPPAFSTELPRDPRVTGNMWLTTNKDGHNTIVPVIGGRIIWNLPNIPHVSFQFPGFPKLPHFHLPCIKIFGIRVSGDCSSRKPEGSEGSETFGDNELPQNDEEDPSSRSSKQSTPTSSIVSATSPSSVSATTTIESCSSTATVSDCEVFCSATASSQACSTTCTRTATGCQATGVTITSISRSACLATALGTANLANRAPEVENGDCDYPCPASIPPPQTTGMFAIDPHEDPDDGEIMQRALAGRIQLQRRVLDETFTTTISVVQQCRLATPPGRSLSPSSIAIPSIPLLPVAYSA